MCEQRCQRSTKSLPNLRKPAPDIKMKLVGNLRFSFDFIQNFTNLFILIALASNSIMGDSK